MTTNKKEKKEVLGTNINISSIVKKAEQKREATASANLVSELKNGKKSQNVIMSITVSKAMGDEYRDLYYKLMKELGSNYVYLSRGEVFVQLINFMESYLNIDISAHKDLYDNYIGVKGRRYNNERTIPKGVELMKQYRWCEFTPEQLETFKKLLTKLAVRVGVEKKADFSKQYFMFDIIDFFRDNIVELAEYIKNAKNGQ